MSLTLMLDLDDTLLDTNLDSFIPAYFKALSGALAEKIDPNEMLPALIGGTKLMVANEDPRLTLREVFDEYFYNELRIDRDSIQTDIDKFYDEVFPSLGKLTRPRPEAVKLVEWAFSRGFRVVIATNPLFPIKAIHHRLRWAGLSPEIYPFALVTSYENMHFTKSPAYYAEVLARLGWPDDPVVMVGDDAERDILPARAMGIPVFHITVSGESDIMPAPDGAGRISDVRNWLESIDDLSAAPLNIDTPEAIMAVLRSTPAGLADLAENIPQEQWIRCPSCDEWSLNEIFCHLRDVEIEINLPRVRTMLEEANPFIAGQVTDDWVQLRGYDSQDGHAALLELAEKRKQLVTLLSGLSKDDWKRPARHSIFGPTFLLELTGFMASHDRSHIQQVMATIREVIAH
jgi:FMN phosphatase YigB (HAD superfamily)